MFFSNSKTLKWKTISTSTWKFTPFAPNSSKFYGNFFRRITALTSESVPHSSASSLAIKHSILVLILKLVTANSQRVDNLYRSRWVGFLTAVSATLSVLQYGVTTIHPIFQALDADVCVAYIFTTSVTVTAIPRKTRVKSSPDHQIRCTSSHVPHLKGGLEKNTQCDRYNGKYGSNQQLETILCCWIVPNQYITNEVVLYIHEHHIQQRHVPCPLTALPSNL